MRFPVCVAIVDPAGKPNQGRPCLDLVNRRLREMKAVYMRSPPYRHTWHNGFAISAIVANRQGNGRSIPQPIDVGIENDLYMRRGGPPEVSVINRNIMISAGDYSAKRLNMGKTEPRSLVILQDLQLLLRSVSLSCGIHSEVCQVLDGALEVRRVGGILVGEVGNKQRSYPHQESQPLVDSQTSKKATGTGLTLVATILGAVGAACGVGALGGADFGFGWRDRIIYGAWAIGLLVAAWWLLSHYAAPLLQSI